MTRNLGPVRLLVIGVVMGGAGCNSKDALLSRSDGASDQGAAGAPGVGGTSQSTGGATGAGGVHGTGGVEGPGTGGTGVGVAGTGGRAGHGAGEAGKGGTGSAGRAADSGGQGGKGGKGGGGVNGGGGIVGTGGQSQGGSGDPGGVGGGAAACQAIDALSRSCVTDADCTIGAHQANCCGQTHYLGIRLTEYDRFTALEPSCRATFPACPCAIQLPVMDDGSVDMRMNKSPVVPASVTCWAGTCTTYVGDCGKPCAAATTCFSCQVAGGRFGACTTTCADATGSSDCMNASLPLCQTGTTGNVSGMYCTAAGVACDKK